MSVGGTTGDHVADMMKGHRSTALPAAGVVAPDIKFYPQPGAVGAHASVSGGVSASFSVASIADLSLPPVEPYHGPYVVDVPVFFGDPVESSVDRSWAEAAIVSTNPKGEAGRKKPRAHFIPPVAILEEARVMELGAAKYGPFNWQDSAVDASTYYDAMMRHMLQWFSGENSDAESGAPHLAHIRACCAILMDAAATGQLIDDRPAKIGSASAVIEAHMARKAA